MGITQDEIVQNAQTVTKGLEALRLEHQTLLGGMKTGVEPEDESILTSQQEKCAMLER